LSQSDGLGIGRRGRWKEGRGESSRYEAIMRVLGRLHLRASSGEVRRQTGRKGRKSRRRNVLRSIVGAV
jgi:hypothetical protein